MPNSIPAAAEGMPKINRRNALALAGGGIMAAVSCATVTAAVSYQAACRIPADAGLFSLLRDHQAAGDALQRALDDLDWLVAEWRHLWPSAPEEILCFANAHLNGRSEDSAERDLAGNYVMRDIPMHWDRRREGGQTCYAVATPEKLIKTLNTVQARKVTGRTPASLERNQRQHEAYINRLRQEIDLARQYQDETARIRELSGVPDAKARVEQAKREVSHISERIMGYPVATLAGLSVKADFYLSDPLAKQLATSRAPGKANIVTFACSISEDIKRLEAGQEGSQA